MSLETCQCHGGEQEKRHPQQRGTPRRTLMRPLVVKGQKYPLGGFLAFFPPVGFQHRWPAAACPDLISHAGAPMWLHQTLIEVRSPCL